MAAEWSAYPRRRGLGADAIGDRPITVAGLAEAQECWRVTFGSASHRLWRYGNAQPPHGEILCQGNSSCIATTSAVPVP
jgi:hypothetical protein